MKRSRHASQESPKVRSWKHRGVVVEVEEAKNRVALKLDGNPIDVSVVDGEIHCQLANQFTAFGSIDDVVDTLLANDGRTWSLDGHFCCTECQDGAHHHDSGHDHVHGHDDGSTHSHG